MVTEPEVIDTTAVVVSNGHSEPLALVQGTPTEIVERATEMADRLRDVINKQHLYANIQGKKHVTVEGWTTLGALCGVFPVVAWSRPIEAEDISGWEARVEVRTLAGQVIGAAEAQCTRSERSWSGRDDYALRSMAQTRATSKAMRLPLAWIMSLAGFEVTPAEEMPRDEAPQQAPTGDRQFVVTEGRNYRPCANCGYKVEVGEHCAWNPSEKDKGIWHVECPNRVAEGEPGE